MAYGRRRVSRYSRRPSRSRYSTRRRPTYRRRRSTGRARSQRVIIQVVGGPSGVAASPVSIGMKSARVVRRRF